MTVKTTRVEPGTKLRDADKMAHIPIKVVPSERETMLRKPDWLRIKLPRTTDKIESYQGLFKKTWFAFSLRRSFMP